MPTTMKNHRKILIFCYQGQGHINPTLQFASRLVKMGVDVTFCSSFSVIRSIQKSSTTPHGVTFAPFFDGHENGKQPTTTWEEFISDFARNGACAVAEIISSMEATGKPYDHVVYTTAVPWVAKVANEHNVKSTLLWCQPATIFDIYYYYFNGYETLLSSNYNDPMFEINFPGLPALTMADLPSLVLPSCPKEHHIFVQLFKDHIDSLKICPRVLINTIDELEFESIRAIEKIQFLPIGPLTPPELLVQKNSTINSSSAVLFEKPVDDYVHWLNTKPKWSVVYVSFGSITNLSMDQADEMATGLLESRRPFLWVIRGKDESLKLSKIDELRKQGMIVSWCKQVEVLSHQAIGCFVTHCGWNSTLEALVGGVPVVAFPMWSDQATTGKMIEDVWKTGVRVRKRESDGVVEGKEIERCVEMMMGDVEMRKNAHKLRDMARNSLKNDGSSTVNLQAFLDDA